MTNTNHTQPQGMSGLKKIVLGTVVASTILGAGLMGRVLYVDQARSEHWGKIHTIQKVPYEERTLEQSAFLESTNWGHLNQDSLKNHPELKDKKMKEIDEKYGKILCGEYNYKNAYGPNNNREQWKDYSKTKDLSK
jgi:hypothetical protein